jgi:hypothetical protein
MLQPDHLRQLRALCVSIRADHAFIILNLLLYLLNLAGNTLVDNSNSLKTS